MAGNEVFHVAVVAPNIPEPEVIKKSAAIISKDLYQTRLLLSGGLPRLIVHYSTLKEAESTALDLTGLGLVAFVCQNSELHKPSKVFTAQSMEFLEQEIIFHNGGGQNKRIKSADVFLILKGILQISDEEEITETKRKINWGATLLMGGIPIYRNVKEKISGARVREETFLRLYIQEYSEPAVQMLQHGMAYSFLGAQIAPSSAANFNTVVTRLQKSFSRAIFDERLMKSSVSDALSARASDDL